MTNDNQNKYPETIFKSAYMYEDKLMLLFLNFRKVTQSFSFIIKKGQWSFVFNTRDFEKHSFAKAVMRQLTVEERHKVISEIVQEELPNDFSAIEPNQE